jgi:hypothetical protein
MVVIFCSRELQFVQCKAVNWMTGKQAFNSRLRRKIFFFTPVHSTVRPTQPPDK